MTPPSITPKRKGKVAVPKEDDITTLINNLEKSYSKLVLALSKLL